MSRGYDRQDGRDRWAGGAGGYGQGVGLSKGATENCTINVLLKVTVSAEAVVHCVLCKIIALGQSYFCHLILIPWQRRLELRNNYTIVSPTQTFG